MRADTMAEKALRIRKSLGNLQNLSLSYATKGRIAEALGLFTEAGRYHRTAVDLAKEIDDFDNAFLFQTNVAAAERRAHDFEAARKLLEEGLQSKRPNVRTRALHELVKIHIEEAQTRKRQEGQEKQEAITTSVKFYYDEAEKVAQEALGLAEKTGDDYLTTVILFDLALITFLREQRKDKARLDALESILKNHDYPAEKGRLEELMGHLAYEKGDLPTAFVHYLKACEILGKYKPGSFQRTFQRVRDKFLDATPEVQEQICQLIEQKFPSVHPALPLARLKELCAFADF